MPLTSLLRTIDTHQAGVVETSHDRGKNFQFQIGSEHECQQRSSANREGHSVVLGLEECPRCCLKYLRGPCAAQLFG